MDIFQELDDKFDLTRQIYNLSALLVKRKVRFYLNIVPFYYDYTFESFFDQYLFASWKYSRGRNSLEEIKKNIGIYSEYDAYRDVPDNSLFIPKNQEDVIKYLQYAFNIVKYATAQKVFADKYFIDSFNDKIQYILSKINQQFIKHDKENYYIVVPCNNKTQRCAQLQTDKEVVFLLFEYTSNLLNVSRKREILRSLANAYEPTLKELKKIGKNDLIGDIANKLSSCLNNFNIRHNNSDPKISKNYNNGLQNFKNKDYEELYDAVYDMILDITLLKEYREHTITIYDKYKDKAGIE